MIGRHIDILAVAALLIGVALLSQARRAVLITGPLSRITVERPLSPAITLPELPHVRFTMD